MVFANAEKSGPTNREACEFFRLNNPKNNDTLVVKYFLKLWFLVKAFMPWNLFKKSQGVMRVKHGEGEMPQR